MSPKLICFDMDGVIFQAKNFWMELHRALGTLEEGQKLTASYLHTDYPLLVQEVVGKLWKDRDATPYFKLIKSIPYLPGVKDVFAKVKEEKWMTALISSASIDLARRAQHDLGIDFIYANELVIKNNIITGDFVWPIGAGREKKAQILTHLCQDLGINPKQVIYIGDSDTDINAFKIVGKAIAFNSSSSELKKAATHIVNDQDLRSILPFL